MVGKSQTVFPFYYEFIEFLTDGAKRTLKNAHLPPLFYRLNIAKSREVI